MGGGHGIRCEVSVDGRDFRIMQPQPFNPKWCSHKFNGPAVWYEVGVCIKMGWLVQMIGPFPAGSWPNLNIARAINLQLDHGDFYVVDGGCNDGHQWAATPTGINNVLKWMYALIRAMHETANRRLQTFKILGERFRHPLVKHGMVFRAVASVVQTSIMYDEPLFSISYNDN